jgi:repressor of nif and glnA expression
MSKKNIGLPVPKKGEVYTSRSVRYPLITDELSMLMGRVLTVIDASIADKEQLKAIKDLIRERFSNVIHERFWDYCYRKEYRPLGPIEEDNIVEGTLLYK